MQDAFGTTALHLVREDEAFLENSFIRHAAVVMITRNTVE